MKAARLYSPEAVELLLAYGANVLALDKSGHNALNYCSSNDAGCAPAIAKLIVAHMQKNGCSTQESLNATLCEAVTKNRRRNVCSLITTLIDLGASPQILDRKKNSLLDVSLLQLSPFNNVEQNTAIKGKIKALFKHGAQTNSCDMRNYLGPEEIAYFEDKKTKFEQKKAEKLVRLADEQYMAAKHAQEPNLLALPFAEHHALTTLEELNEHTPFPKELTQFTHEHLFSTSRPNKRKRAADSDDTSRQVALKTDQSE